MNDTTTEKPPVLDELKTKEYVSWGVTSFAAFDAEKLAREQAEHVMSLSDTFMQLVYNVTYSDQIADKKSAMMDLIEEFSTRLSNPSDEEDMVKKEGRKKFSRSDYLINTSENPDDWKYLVVKQSGKPDLDALNLAVDSLQKELLSEMSGMELVGVQARTKELYKGLGVVAEQQPDFVQTLPNLFLWKEQGEAPMRWMMFYSNNSMDRDPVEPNLFKARSHKAFAELANSGVLPMPEAWVWHVPGSRWGIADHIMVLEDDDGFTLPLAFGTVDPGMEGVAERLSKEKNLLVSHGVPRKMIVYDAIDPRLIDFAPTIEISVLPAQNAANELTAVIL